MLLGLMQHHASLRQNLLNLREARSIEGDLLFLNCHIKLVIGHSVGAVKMIANQVTAAGSQHGPHLSVQFDCIAFVA